MSKGNQKVQLLAFWLAERRFGIPVCHVRRVVSAADPTPLPQAPESVSGIISLNGVIVPVLDVRRRFGFSDREIGLQDQFIIADTSRRTVALWVDSTSGVIDCTKEEIVGIKAISDNSNQIEGVIQLEDGLLLIHDLERFLHPKEELALDGALESQADRGN